MNTTENGDSKIERVQFGCHSLQNLSSYLRIASRVILDRIVSKSKYFARYLIISLIELNSMAKSLNALNPTQALTLYSISYSQLHFLRFVLSILQK